MSTKRANNEGSIRQRPDGRWEARYTVGTNPGTGKPIRKSIYGDTQQEVAKKLRAATTAIDEGTYMEPSKMTVGQWIDIWTKDYTNHLKPGTIALYEKSGRNYIKPYLGNVKLSSLKPHVIQGVYNDFTNGVNGKPLLTARTVKNTHGILHKALEQAVELGYIKSNPSNACKLPRVEKASIQPLDDIQIGEFLNAIKGHRHEALFVVDLFTGMRQGEVIGLTWDCIDFEKGIIHIYRQLQLIKGEYIFGSLKNNKSRTITPAPTVMKALREHKRVQAEWKLKAGQLWGDGDFVFTDEIGNHLARQSVYRSFKRVAESIGVPETRFHDLRHSYAVAALRSGDDVKTVQETLGHHTAAFTLDVYGHVTDQMRSEAAARMEAYIQGVKTTK